MPHPPLAASDDNETQMICSCYFTRVVYGNRMLFHKLEMYNCRTRAEVRDSPQEMADHNDKVLPHTKLPLVQGMSSIVSEINLHSI